MHDTINRQDAIDALMNDADWADAIPTIKSLPSSEPNTEWIPCSERLPEIHDEVLVTAHGEVSIAWLYLDGEWRSNDMPQQMFKDIIAWMPLPEPYREDGEE